jgi:hypothetical protein
MAFDLKPITELEIAKPFPATSAISAVNNVLIGY